ncbi:MAG: tetratricopeptide repeat protein [Nitrososphaera sp.]
MESHPQEHFITLPLVSKSEESVQLPLVINVVAKYWGEDITDRDSAGSATVQKGTILIEGIEIAERRGFMSYIYRGSTKDLKKRIDQGIPPIVIMPGLKGLAQHATIVCGYNPEERRILTYVPEPDTVGAIPEGNFEQEWEQDDMTTIVIVPSDMKDLFKDENLKFAASNRLCFEAERLRQKEDVEGAIKKVENATEIDSDNAQAWCILAGIYNEIGSEAAVPYYEKAIKLNPRFYLAYRGLGNYYLKRHEYSLAEHMYTEAIRINATRFGSVYKNRGLAKMQLGNSAGAKEDFQEYLEQAPFAEDRKAIEEALLEL